MQQRIKRLMTAILFLALPAMMLSSCGGKSDRELAEAIGAKKAAVQDLSTLTISVSKGVVTLSGECKDQASKDMCESTIKAIPGVKDVVNNCTIAAPAADNAMTAPVSIASDDALNKGVNDAIKDFNGVKADVKDGVVTLTGNIKRSDLPKLMMSLNSLKPKKIDNQLTVQ